MLKRNIIIAFVLLWALGQAKAESAESAESNDPKTMENIIKARRAFEAKNFDDSIKYYELVIGDDSISNEIQSEAYLNLGKSYENEDEIRDAAYFYGEFVRKTKMSHQDFSQALFKAGELNFKNADPEKDQGFTEMAIFYLSNFLELFPENELVQDAIEKVAISRDINAEYHYSQFGKYYFRHDNFCGAFIAFEDSLSSSEKFKSDIINYANDCKSSKRCSKEIKECSARFKLRNIDALKVLSL